MLSEVEIEYKYLISSEQFHKLSTVCEKKYTFLKRKLQVNYYYDTNDNALSRSKITVRIRQSQNELQLQIKKQMAEKESVTVSEEYSDSIDELPHSMRIPDVQNKVSLKGNLITERTIYSFGENSIICFDMNMYLGICDYEVEIEVRPNDRQEVSAVIDALGLKKTSVMSKRSRFFERLEGMKNE